MSENDILTKVSSLRPNPYGSYLGDYLKSLELRIRTEIFGESEPSYSSDCLILQGMDCQVYELYLFSVIDFLNGEYGRYENDLAAFNAAFSLLSRKATEKNTCPERSFTIWKN